MMAGMPRRLDPLMRQVLRADSDPTPRERLDVPPPATSRASVGWLHSGSWESSARRLVAVVATPFFVALAAWRLLAAPDLAGFHNVFADVRRSGPCRRWSCSSPP